MDALRDLLHHLRAEGRQIVRLAAGHRSLVDMDLLVDPCAAGVTDVCRQARPPCDRSTSEDISLHQEPGPMGDRTDRLARVEKRAYEGHGGLVSADLIRTRDAARGHKRVIVIGVHVLDRAVDRERASLLQTIDARDGARPVGHQLWRGAVLLDGFPRLRQRSCIGSSASDLVFVGGETSQRFTSQVPGMCREWP